MEQAGYKVFNSSGEDLDIDLEVAKIKVDAVTAFEIFDHLVAPYNILRAIET